MKKCGWFALAFVCAALLLLAGSALVEGPVLLAPPEKAEASAADAPRLEKADALPAEMGHVVRTDEGIIRRMGIREEPAAADAACVHEADGNGYPITGRTYVRTVYAACPLEDMPG